MHAAARSNQTSYPRFRARLIARLLGSSLTLLCVSDLKCPDKCSVVAAIARRVYVTLTSACTPSQENQASIRYPCLGKTDLAARSGGAEMVMGKWSVEVVVSWARAVGHDTTARFSVDGFSNIQHRDRLPYDNVINIVLEHVGSETPNLDARTHSQTIAAI